MNKYSKSASRLIPDTSGHFREYIRKWLLLAGSVGLVTGAAVLFLDYAIRIVLLGGDYGIGQLGLVSIAYDSSPVASFLLPFFGLTAAGLLLRGASKEPALSGTDEVLNHYHNRTGGISLKEGVVKFFASILTIGLGGSAGLEGPSINAGAVVGSAIWSRTKSGLRLNDDDLRILMLAGASAGIGAIFKAPLTGIVFALEVPYKDDIARKAFLPSMISGVTSYITYASVNGIAPLFSVPIVTSGFNLLDIALSAVLGLTIGLLSVGFAYLFHGTRRLFQGGRIPLIARFILGGAIVGAIALVVRLAFTLPFTYGAGYNIIQASLNGSFALPFLFSILVLRMVATSVTLGCGGVGGIFFPLVVFGSMVGSIFGIVVHQNVAVFASVGIAAFMSAGYKTPLAAVTFVGDTTGSVSYLIPAMIASAIAYISSGESTVSSEQKLREDSPMTTGGNQAPSSGDLAPKV